MEYKINELGKIAGVSTRTLRYYDEIGLLNPKTIYSNGYRVYGKDEVDLLQQILFYKELDVNLEEIKKIIYSKDFDKEKSLNNHLDTLLKKRDKLNLLITNVKKTLLSMKGEIIMNDKEKFEGLKKGIIDENEKKYGKEIREKYGDVAVDDSYKKLMNMTQEKYVEAEKVQAEFNETLKKAFMIGNPASELAQKACALHEKWLTFYADYSKDYHKGLANMYITDERFKKHYDDIEKGCAKFLHDAIIIYCEKD